MKRFFKFGHSSSGGSGKRRENEANVGDHHGWAPRSRLSSLSDSSSGWGSVVNFNLDDSRKPSNIKGFTKLHKACWAGNLDKVKKHLKNVDINQADSLNRTPLNLACAQGHKNVILYLLSCKPNLNIKDVDGNTPLLVAILNRHQDICSVLLDDGANPNDSNLNGDTGLHLAARYGLQDVAFSLVSKQADINSTNNDESTPLHVATSVHQLAMVKLLLRLGANVNQANKNQITSLMIACDEGFEEMVELFITQQVDVSSVNAEGLTAEDIARLAENHQCVEMLQKYGLQNNATATDIKNDLEILSDHIDSKQTEAKKADKESDSDSWNDDYSDELPCEKPIRTAGINLSKLVDFGSDIKTSVDQKLPSQHLSTEYEETTEPIANESNGDDNIQQHNHDHSPDIANVNMEMVPPKIDHEDHGIDHSDVSGLKSKNVHRDLLAELGLSDISDVSDSLKSGDNFQKNNDEDSEIEEVKDTGKQNTLVMNEDDTDVEEVKDTERQNPLLLNEDSVITNQVKSSFIDSLQTGYFPNPSEYIDSDEESESVDVAKKNHSAVKKDNEGTLGRPGTMHEVDELWENNAYVHANDWTPDEEEANIYYAQLAVIDSKGSTIEREKSDREDIHLEHENLEGNAPLKPLVDYEIMWDEVCHQLFGKLNEENDESSYSLSGMVTEDENRENSLKDLTFQEVSSADDRSNFSALEDRPAVLLSSIIKDPANNDKILSLVNRLRHNWLKEQNRCQSIQQSTKHLKAEIQRTRSKYESMNSNRIETENKFSQLESELEELRHQLSGEEAKRQELELHLDRNKSQLQGLEENYLLEVNLRQEAQVALRASQEELRATEEVFDELQEKRTLVGVADKSTMISEPLQNLDKRETEEIIKLNDENKNLRNQLNLVQQHCVQIEDERNILQRQLSDLKTSVEEREKVVDSLKRDLELTSDSSVILKHKDEEIEDLRKKLRLIENEKSLVANELISTKDEREKLRSKFVNLESEIKVQKKKFDDDNERMVNHISTLENKLETLQVHYNSCKAELEVATKLNAFYKDSQNGIQSKWETVIETLQKKQESMNIELIEIREKALNDKSRLMGEINELMIQKSEVEMELGRVRRERLRANEILSSTEANLQEKEQALFVSETNLKSLKRENMMISEQINQFLEREKDHLAKSQNLQILTKELEGLKSQSALETIRADSETDTNRKLNQEIKSLQKETFELSTMKEELQLQLENLKRQIEAERSETTQIKNIKETELCEIKKKWSSDKMVIEDLKQKLFLKDEENEQLKRSLQRLEINGKDTSKFPSVNLLESQVHTFKSSNDQTSSGHIHDDKTQQETAQKNNFDQQFGSLDNLHQLMESFIKEMQEERKMMRSGGLFNRFENDPNSSQKGLSDYLQRSELELLKRQFETQYQMELNRKLEQINRFLEEQARATDHLEEIHNRSRTQMQREYQTAMQSFQIEVNRLQVFMKEKEMRQIELEEQHRHLKELITAKKRIKRKLNQQPTLSPTFMNNQRFRVEDFTALRSSHHTRINDYKDTNLLQMPLNFHHYDLPLLHRDA